MWITGQLEMQFITSVRWYVLESFTQVCFGITRKKLALDTGVSRSRLRSTTRVCVLLELAVSCINTFENPAVFLYCHGSNSLDIEGSLFVTQ